MLSTFLYIFLSLIPSFIQPFMLYNVTCQKARITNILGLDFGSGIDRCRLTLCPLLSLIV